jgi:glutaredoxin 3
VATVEIYTKASCGFCTRAKRMLDMKKIDYREIAIDRDAARREEMIQRANGRTTVPQIFIDGRHVGGCDDLMALEYDGKLDALLAA